MGSKNKRAAGVVPSAGQPARQEVDRLIAKGWYKDAVRQAKICYRDQPTPEHHKLLEQAYLLRAQELQKNGMAAAAQEVASHLLDFGATDPDMTEPLATLLVAVGLANRALELQSRLGSSDALERLNRQAADQAVLHPARASGTPKEIRESAAKVRAALEALTSGDEPKAQELLRDVGRNSPLAEWRVFARGLAAFRRGDDTDARANWDRLDPERAPFRIARSLIEATESNLLDGPVTPKFQTLERWALGEPILGPLRELALSVSQGLWPDAIRKVGPIRVALRRIDPALAVRVTEALYAPILREATKLSYRDGSNLIRNFTKAAEPLPIDPRWNRIWAQVWEGPRGHPMDAEPFWRKFIEDLESSPVVRPEDRPKARAMVLTHIGKQLSDLAFEFDPPEPPGARSGPNPVKPRPVDEEAMGLRRKAVTLLEESRTLFPLHRETHQALIDVHKESGQLDRAAEAASRLIQSLPDDLDTLKYLTTHYFSRDDSEKALGFMLRARALKPLDADLIQSEWSCRVAVARKLALLDRWDEARAELETADRLLPEKSQSLQVVARKASIELKAGRLEVAATILEEAIGGLNEPTSLWLAMAIEARRYHLPQSDIDRYETLFATSVSRKVQGETAGAMVELLDPFLTSRIIYPGRDEHIRLVVAYLAKTTKINYSRENLSHVCSFLEVVDGQDDVLQKLANRGIKLFPGASEFPLLLGKLEMKKGPFRANLKKTRGYVETALRLAEVESKTDPKLASIVSGIRQFLTVLNELTNSPLGLPFFGGGKPPADIEAAFQAMMDDEGFDPDFDDEFDDEDEEFWDPEDAPAPDSRTPRKKKAKNKKKRK